MRKEFISVPSAGGAGVTLSWQVDNIDAVHDRMIADGIDVTTIKVI